MNKTEWVFALPDGSRWSWHGETELECRVEMALLGVEVGDLLAKRVLEAV